MECCFIYESLHTADGISKTYSVELWFSLTACITQMIGEDSQASLGWCVKYPPVTSATSQGALMTHPPLLVILRENTISLFASLVSDNAFTGNTVAKKGKHCPNSHGALESNHNATWCWMRSPQHATGRPSPPSSW